MGLSPYINAVIIIQLLGVIVPKIRNMQKEGETVIQLPGDEK